MPCGHVLQDMIKVWVMIILKEIAPALQVLIILTLPVLVAALLALSIPVTRASNVMGRRLDLIKQTSRRLPPFLAVVTAMALGALTIICHVDKI